jgi:hypothetical protein
MNKFPPNVHDTRRLWYSGDISQALEKPGRNFTQVGEAPTWKILSHHVEFCAMYTPSLNDRSFILRLKLNLIIHFSSHFHSLLLPLQTHPAVFLNASIWFRTVMDHLLFIWQDLQDFVIDWIVVHIPFQYIAAFIVSLRHVCPGCCR